MKVYIGETKRIRVPFNPAESIKVNVLCNKICIGEKRSKKIEGYVYNYCTGEPIKGAKIVVQNRLFYEEALTDDNGYYRLYIPFINFRYNIMISKRGYRGYKNDSIYISNNKQNFYL